MFRYNVIIKSALFLEGLLCFTGFAMANRITAPTDPAARCAGIGVPVDICTRRRTKALEEKCITQEEYDTLVQYGSYAMCDYDEPNPDLKLSGWCSCGCFEQSVNLLVSQGEMFSWTRAGEVLHEWKSTQLASLTSGSSMESFSFEGRSIRLATKGKEENKLYYIGTKNGNGLRLTSEHPVLLANGKMTPAKRLKVGDSLLGVDGLAKLILSIERKAPTSEVVNFAVDAESKISHIIAAEGVLVGDLVWQGSLADEEKALAIRL